RGSGDSLAAVAPQAAPASLDLLVLDNGGSGYRAGTDSIDTASGISALHAPGCAGAVFHARRARAVAASAKLYVDSSGCPGNRCVVLRAVFAGDLLSVEAGLSRNRRRAGQAHSAGRTGHFLYFRRIARLGRIAVHGDHALLQLISLANRDCGTE